MRAAVIEAPHRLVVKDVEQPICGDDEILVRIHRAAICNLSDWEVYTGSSSIMDYVGGYPHILGHEQSGEVVEVGKDVTGFAEGDRLTWYVKATGAFGEYNTLNPSKLAVVKLGDRVSYDEGAVLELAGGGAMRNVYGSGLRPTDTAAVIGVGPAGLLTGMVARLFGAKHWIAFDMVDFRLQTALELGASAAFNVLEMDGEEIAHAIRERFGEVDVVFETMGVDRSPDQSGLDLAIRIVKPGGNVRLFTIAPTRHPLSIGDALMKGVNFVGRKVSVEKTQDLLELAHRWVAEGRYPIRELITHHVSLEDVEEGLKLVHVHPEEAIKVVVDVC
jgi:threonine dehydrogenase-like Zn-dependent dehydrogenase